MDEEKCAKCGEALQPGAVSCWACGELTPAGRKAKGANNDDDEVWRQSVEAARRRQGETPPLDPEEALKRVLADAGVEEPRPGPARSKAGPQRPLAEAAKLRDSARTVATLGMLLAVLLALVGVLLVVVCILTQAGMIAALAAVAAMILFGTLSLAVHFAFRNLADIMSSVALIADDTRRSLALLREQAATAREKTQP